MVTLKAYLDFGSVLVVVEQAAMPAGWLIAAGMFDWSLLFHFSSIASSMTHMDALMKTFLDFDFDYDCVAIPRPTSTSSSSVSTSAPDVSSCSEVTASPATATLATPAAAQFLKFVMSHSVMSHSN